jgi:DNA-binding NarL/FixJ family response regulator
MARDVIRMNAEIDLRDRLSSISVPTLILHRAGDTWIEVGHGRYLAENIPGAKFVELPGADHRAWLGDTDVIVSEVETFLLGRHHRPRRRSDIGASALSRRERQVAVMAARGQTAPEIARQLSLSVRTVETHLSGIYTKLGVRSKTELIRRSRELGV